jgi:hypothetical protein
MSSHVHGEFTDFPLWAINMKQRLLNKLVDAKLTRCKTACVTDALGWTKEELKKKLGSRHAKKVVDQLKLFKIPLKGETREDSP